MTSAYRIPMILFQTLLASLSFVIVYYGIIFLPSTTNTLELLVDLIFYILFLPTCNTMLMKVMWVSESTRQTELAYNAIEDLFLAKTLKYCAHTKTLSNFNIDVSDVSFKYPGAKINAIDNINFSVKQGQTIAFVGESGSGKSTLVSLM